MSDDETATAAAQRMNAHAMDLWQRDHRFRMMAQSAVAEALDRHGPVDPERADRIIHDVALEACVTLLARVYAEDGEIHAAHIERDHYKRIVESALLTQPVRMLVTKYP